MQDSFKDRLVALRKENNFTQDKLAESLEVAKSTISMYEKGNRMPSYEMLEKIADFFNVDIDYLMGKSNVKRRVSVTPQSMTEDDILNKKYHLDIGKRVKEKREELGLSQEQLAEILGYKSKTSIHKVEQGITDLPLSKLSEFAKALKTTPSYLMGWTEEETKIKLLPKRERLQLEELLKQNAMFFNDETVSDEDKEKFLSALQEAFFEVKFLKQQERKNKK